jgi:carbon-monoxide dehydrogenase medium subunit
MVPRFSLVRPESLEAAFAAHLDRDGDAAWYAGGTELLQVMKMGLAPVSALIDLKGIPGLATIARTDDGALRIGGTVTHRAIERSPLVAGELPGLVRLERHLANVRVRNAGTLGGNLAFAEPHSDPATFLLACGATVDLVGPAGERTLGMEELVLGPFLTAREPDEILVAVEVPARRSGEGRAYAKIAFFERPAASVAVRLLVAGGAVAEAVVAVGSLTEVPVLVSGAAHALLGAEATRSGLGDRLVAARGALAAVEALDDHNGSAAYKLHLAGVLLERAAHDALAEALADA